VDLSEEKIVNAFARVIIKNSETDPITLAERLKDRLIHLMEDAEGGSGMLPVRIVEESAEDRPRSTTRRPTPVRDKQTALPPPPKSSLIITPDDPEFEEAARQTRTSSPGGRSRPSNIGPEATGTDSSIEYWSLETLIKALNDNTPSEVYFTPNGMDAGVKVRAVRNVQAIVMIQGPHLVKLTYKNAGVADDYSSTDANGQLDHVVIGLIASETFSLTERNLNIEGRMDSIMQQLAGLYAPRSQNMEPSGRDPGPLDFNFNDRRRAGPMGYDVPKQEMGEIQSNWQVVQDPAATVLHNVTQANKRFGGDPNRRN
jgi:hypothetical protein